MIPRASHRYVRVKPCPSALSVRTRTLDAKMALPLAVNLFLGTSASDAVRLFWTKKPDMIWNTSLGKFSFDDLL
jgi:hypothetical protein